MASINRLSDRAIKAARPRDKLYRLADGQGLHLEVSATGVKSWRMRYRRPGTRTENMLTLGQYPAVTLAMARQRRDEARQQVAAGIDPAAARDAERTARADRAANTFERVALEWYARMRDSWEARHAERQLSRLQRLVLPSLGARPIAEITAPEILEALRPIEERGTIETAHRVRGIIGQVMRYAIATGRAERDPAADLRGALKPAPVRHHPAPVNDYRRIGELLRMMDGYRASLPVCCALRMGPHVFVRPGELRHARWADIDMAGAEWRFTASKTHQPHMVPLSRQVVAILGELQPLTGHGEFVFPSARGGGRPMSENAVLAAVRTLGIGKDEMTPHAWRAVARTVLAETLGYRPDIIDHQLAHAVRDPLGQAYNRTQYLAERKAMMQAWSDWLDRQRDGAEVVAFPGRQAGAHD